MALASSSEEAVADVRTGLLMVPLPAVGQETWWWHRRVVLLGTDKSICFLNDESRVIGYRFRNLKHSSSLLP